MSKGGIRDVSICVFQNGATNAPVITGRLIKEGEGLWGAGLLKDKWMVFTKNREEIARVMISYARTETVKLPWDLDVQCVPWIEFKEGRSFSRILEMDWLKVEMPPLNDAFGFHLVGIVGDKKRLEEAMCVALAVYLRKKELDL